MAPTAKPPAVPQPSGEKASTRNSTAPTIPIVVYWRFRYAPAPCWIAAAISCMRALPGDWARIQRTEKIPYRIAATPAPIASQSARSVVIA